MSRRRIVGLDVGTSGVKALALDPDGSIAARAEVHYPSSRPQPGWSEQDPESWWRAASEALEEVADGTPAGIGLSGQMHGLVCLDGADRPLRPAILWNDQRAARERAELEDELGLERLVQQTGNRALPGFTAPSLLWVRRNEPNVYGRIARVLLPKDYVRLRLTGEYATDVSDASGTLLFDVAHRRWSEPVLRELELPATWLPRALESVEVSGLTAAGVPVAAGAGDQAAGALGVGIDRPEHLSVVLGTSGVVFAVLPDFRVDPRARLHTFCHAAPKTWHAMGVMLSAGGAIAWLRTVLDADYNELTREAEASAPGGEGVFFTPYLAGERTPHADPDARAAFVGLGLHHGRGALFRAALEGVAFGLRDSLGLLRELGVAAEVGRISGGGSRNTLWVRIVASVLGVPLERTAADEGAAYGAALLGGVAAGWFASVEEAIDTCVRVESRVEPIPAWEAVYDASYPRYQSLYSATAKT